MLNDLVAYYVDHTPGLEPYREENEALVCGAGAQEVAFGEDGSAAREFGPYHLVLESVGGRVLGDALSMLAPGGTCVTFGASAAAETTFDVRGASTLWAGPACTALYSSMRCWTSRRPRSSRCSRASSRRVGCART